MGMKAPNARSPSGVGEALAVSQVPCDEAVALLPLSFLPFQLASQAKTLDIDRYLWYTCTSKSGLRTSHVPQGLRKLRSVEDV